MARVVEKAGNKNARCLFCLGNRLKAHWQKTQPAGPRLHLRRFLSGYCRPRREICGESPFRGTLSLVVATRERWNWHVQQSLSDLSLEHRYSHSRPATAIQHHTLSQDTLSISVITFYLSHRDSPPIWAFNSSLIQAILTFSLFTPSILTMVSLRFNLLFWFLVIFISVMLLVVILHF